MRPVPRDEVPQRGEEIDPPAKIVLGFVGPSVMGTRRSQRREHRIIGKAMFLDSVTSPVGELGRRFPVSLFDRDHRALGQREGRQARLRGGAQIGYLLEHAPSGFSLPA